MLLDGISAAQRPLAEARPRLIERRIDAPAAAQLLEQPELGRGPQLCQDHAEQAKFRPRVGAQPAREQLRRRPGNDPPGGSAGCDGALAGEGREVVASDLDTDAGGVELAAAEGLEN